MCHISKNVVIGWWKINYSVHKNVQAYITTDKLLVKLAPDDNYQNQF